MNDTQVGADEKNIKLVFLLVYYSLQDFYAHKKVAYAITRV